MACPPADSVIDASVAGLDRLFSPLKTASGIVAAVSGGPDSVALMHLLARWNQRFPPVPILVATVDHGLRSESAREAAWVGLQAEALGLPHVQLAWEGAKPSTGLQDKARAARYALLVDCARARGASHLVTAHTLDDQAETLLMRMAAGSGLTGLAGMRPERDRDGIRHARPLLGCEKRALVALCQEQGWAFVTDPSNADERFARVRWRRVAPVLAEEGLTARRLASLAFRLARAEDALDAKAAEAYGRAGPDHGPQGLSLDGSVLVAEPFDIAVRVLAKALAAVGMDLHTGRLQRLETCTTHLRTARHAEQALKTSLWGAVLVLNRDGRLTVLPEETRRRGR